MKVLPGLRLGKREEKAPTDTEDEEYLDLLNSMRQFVGIVDKKGKLQFANEETIEKFGYSDDEMLGKPFWEAGWFSMSSQSQRAVQDGVLDALQGQGIRCTVDTFARNGIVLPVSFAINPLKGRDGNIVSIAAETDAGMGQVRQELEDELKETESGFESVLELIQEVYFRVARGGELLLVSHFSADLLHYDSPVELIGKDTLELWAYAEERSEFIAKLMNSGRVEGYEATFCCKDGSHVVVELDSRLLLDEDGEIRGSEGIFRDVTQRIADQEKLREAYADLEKLNAQLNEAVEEQSSSDEGVFTLLDNASDGIAIIADNKVQYLNRNLLERLGYESDELQGASLREMLTQDSADLLEQQYLAGIAGENVQQNCDAEMLAKDGQVLDVEISSIIVDYRGELADMVIVRDLIGRDVEAEKEGGLTDLYALIVDNASDAFVIVKDMDIVFASHRLYEMTGYSREDVESMCQGVGGLGDYLLTATEESGLADFRPVLDKYEDRMSGREVPQTTQLDLPRKDGSILSVELSGSLIQYEEGPADLIVVRDIAERKKAEARLKGIESKYTLIYNTMEDIYFSMSPDGMKILDINPAGIKKLGYRSQKEVIGKKLVDFFADPHDMLDMINRAVEGTYDGNQSVKTETVVRMKNGETLFVELSPYFNFDEKGNLLDVAGILRDVSDRKEAADTLRTSEEHFQMLIDNASDGIAIVDRDGIVRYESPAVERILGYRPAELVGKVVFDSIHPDDMAMIGDIWDSFLSKYGAIQTLELRFSDKEGEWHWMEVVGYNVLDDPKVSGIILNYRDITERKKAEDELRKSEARYRSMFEMVEDIYFRLDPSSMSIVEMNPAGAKLLGYQSPDGVIGKQLWSLFDDPDDLMRMASEVMSNVKEGQSIPSKEAVARVVGGDVLTVEISPHCVFDEHQQVVEVNGIIRDITERKRIEEAMRESEKVLKDSVGKLKESQQEISTPVVQVWDHILALPLIGVIDTTRAQGIMDTLLTRIVETQAEMVILDVTGVASMDTDVTNHLVRTIHSTNLLGAQCVITGIKPEVAQTMIHLGLDTSRFVTKRDMQEGLKWGLTNMGYELKNIYA
ncbi:MAG: PAS domain S-box protein [Chloroflexota bacterium]|nr:PAS domain S-box protein [Chloroflexota bacterium]